MKIKNMFFLILLVLFSSNFCLAMEDFRVTRSDVDDLVADRVFGVFDFLQKNPLFPKVITALVGTNDFSISEIYCRVMNKSKSPESSELMISNILLLKMLLLGSGDYFTKNLDSLKEKFTAKLKFNLSTLQKESFDGELAKKESLSLALGGVASGFKRMITYKKYGGDCLSKEELWAFLIVWELLVELISLDLVLDQQFPSEEVARVRKRANSCVTFTTNHPHIHSLVGGFFAIVASMVHGVEVIFSEK